jgi:hypothetical protein
VVTRQVQSVLLGSDEQTSSTLFADVPGMFVNLNTTQPAFLEIEASFSVRFLAPNTSASMRLLVDGAQVAGFGLNATDANLDGGAFTIRVPAFIQGAHSVRLQWRITSIAGTVAIRPLTNQQTEHASLVVRETSV